MSFNICSISGMPAQQPVISKKTGHVFEQRLIEKHIEATGRCPITKQELYKEDLIEIKIDGDKNHSTSQKFLSKPVSVNLTSMPGMFSELQAQWENVLIETHQLKKELDVARQELAHSLYQYDASCRVICNLLKERDFAREELENYRMEFEDVEEEGFEGEEIDYMGINKDLARRIQELSYKLMADRKNRKINESLFMFDEISNFKCKTTHYPFADVKSKDLINNEIGITCADIRNGDTNLDHLILGSNEGSLGLCRINSNQDKDFTLSNILTLKSFNKSVNDIQFCPSRDIFGFAAGYDDGTSVFYINTNKDNDNLKLSERYRTNNIIHSQAITSISFHPLEEYAIMASLDGYWSFHNLFKVRKKFNKNFFKTLFRLLFYIVN